MSRLAPGNADHERDGFSIRQTILNKQTTPGWIHKQGAISVQIFGIRIDQSKKCVETQKKGNEPIKNKEKGVFSRPVIFALISFSSA